MSTPRIRHLNHRKLERVRYQDDILEFVSERADTLTQYADTQEVWEALKTSNSMVIAGEVDIP